MLGKSETSRVRHKDKVIAVHASLNLYPLWVFVTVVQQSNITRASKTLGISQPAASAHLRQLESALGRPLLERSSRGVRTSPFGKLYYQQAIRVFAEVERLDALASGFQDGEGRVRLSASLTPGAYWLPRLLSIFLQRYPRISPELSVASSKSVVERVLAQEVAIGLIGDLPALNELPDLSCELVAQDTLGLWSCPGNRLAQIPRLSDTDLTHLAQHPIILREPGSSTRSQALEILEPLLGHLGQTLELASGDAVKEATIAGLGLAVLSSWAVARERASNHLMRFRDPRLRRSRAFYIIRRADRPLIGCSRLLWEFLCEQRDC